MGNAVMERLAGICVAFAVLGATLIYDGCSRLVNEAGMSATPVNISLDELIASPPSGHQYVCVLDVTVGETFANVVSQYDSIGTAYIPLQSRRGRYALASTDGISAQSESASDTLTGIARIGSIPEEASRLLDCPGMDPNRALIIELNGKPPSSSKGQWGEITFGGLMWVPMIAALSYAVWRDRRIKPGPVVDSPKARISAPPARATLPAAVLSISPFNPQSDLLLLRKVVWLVRQPGNDFSSTGWLDANVATQDIEAVLDPSVLPTEMGRERARSLFSCDGPLYKLAYRNGFANDLARLAEDAEAVFAMFALRI
jgi:hypothetical protein